MTQYHVSAQAAKTNGAGSAADPFLTIGQAAAIARAGDEVVVHAGTYRESVDPRFGGESATNRIVYRADDEMEKFYRDKATQSRRRGRGHRRRRSENT